MSPFEIKGHRWQPVQRVSRVGRARQVALQLAGGEQPGTNAVDGERFTVNQLRLVRGSRLGGEAVRYPDRQPRRCGLEKVGP